MAITAEKQVQALCTSSSRAQCTQTAPSRVCLLLRHCGTLELSEQHSAFLLGEMLGNMEQSLRLLADTSQLVHKASTSFKCLHWKSSEDVWPALCKLQHRTQPVVPSFPAQGLTCQWWKTDSENACPCVWVLRSVSKPKESMAGMKALMVYRGEPGIGASCVTWPLPKSKHSSSYVSPFTSPLQHSNRIRHKAKRCTWCWTSSPHKAQGTDFTLSPHFHISPPLQGVVEVSTTRISGEQLLLCTALVMAAHLRRASTVYTADTQSAGACTSTK